MFVVPNAQKYANSNLKSIEPGSGITIIYATGKHFTIENRRNIKNLVTPKYSTKGRAVITTCTGTIVAVFSRQIILSSLWTPALFKIFILLSFLKILET